MDTKTLTLWKKRFESAKNWRQPYDNKWDDFYRLYRFYLEEDKKNWKTKLFIPYIFTVIENIVPRIVINKPKIIVEPQAEDDQDAATIQQTILDYEWDQMNGRLKIVDLVKQALIYGTAFAKLEWRFDSKMLLKREPIISIGGLKLGSKVVKRPSVIFDGPELEIPDIKDIFVEPGAEDEQKANWIIQRSVTTLKKLKESGLYDEKALKKVTADDGLNLNEFIQSRDIVTNKDSSQEFKSDDEFIKVEILEGWTDDHVTTMANRKVIIRQEENPNPHGMKPFIRIVDRPVSKELYGIGEAEALEGLQDELNSIRNARMDNVKLQLNKVFVVARSAGVNYKTLKWKPGAIIPVNDVTQVKPLETSDVAMSSFNEETITKGDIQRVSGISEYTMGQGNQSGALGNSTASGIRQILESGNQVIKSKTLMLEEMGLRKIGKMMVALNEFFITEPKVMRIVGPDGPKFPKYQPEEIRGNFDVKVEIGSTEPVDKDVKRNQKLTLFQLLMGNPAVAQWINTQEEVRRLLEIFDEKDIEKLMYTPEQIAQAKAQLQQSQLQDAMGGEGPGTPGEGMLPQEKPTPGQGNEKKMGGLPPQRETPSLQPPVPQHREMPKANTQV